MISFLKKSAWVFFLMVAVSAVFFILGQVAGQKFQLGAMTGLIVWLLVDKFERDAEE